MEKMNTAPVSPEEFDEYIWEIIPQKLFHVLPTDLDDDLGVRIDELMLLQTLAGRPALLKHRSLTWFVNVFINEIRPINYPI